MRRELFFMEPQNTCNISYRAQIQSKSLLALLWIFLTMCARIQANEQGDLDISQMEVSLSAECEPLTTVAGCVNIASGHFFHVETDFKGTTIDPLSLDRFYDSGCIGETFLGAGFGCQFPLIASSIQKGEKHSYAMISERDGFLVPYRGKRIRDYHHCKIDPRVLKKGYTNVNRVGANSNANFINWTATFDQLSDDYQWIVQQGDGSKRLYRKVCNIGEGCRMEMRLPTKKLYLLEEETKANGNILRYVYKKINGKPRLIRVTTLNRNGSAVLNEMLISHEPKSCTLTSSCGHQARFIAKEIIIGNDTVFDTVRVKTLASALSSHGIQTAFSFTGLFHSKNIQIKRIDKPEGRFIEASYDGDGRVIRLDQPGPTGTPICTYRFGYGKHSTSVTNALNQVTSYSFDSKKRLQSIEYIDMTVGKKGEAKPATVRQERFIWSTAKGQEGWLLSKSINLHQRVYQNQVFEYDRKGNIIKKTIYGNMSGDKSESFIKSTDTDSYSIAYEYSQDQRNLMVRQSTPQGWSTSYSYLPGTNLKTVELEFYDGNIQHRLFTTYDLNGEVEKVIEDDGCSSEPDDLTKVSYRLIKIVIAEDDLSLASFGKAKMVHESYLDIPSGHPVLLKRTEFFYDSRGREIRQVVYDSHDTFCYEIARSYDDSGRLSLETNALNQTTRYLYDKNNNKVEEALIGSGKVTTFRYNAANLLVEKNVVHQSGEVFSTIYSYDLLNRMISEIDHFGNETRYAYDRMGREIRKEMPAIQGPDGEVILPCINRKYNVLGQIVEETDENDGTTYYSSNIYGSPTKIVRPDGSIKRFLYHPCGWLKQEWQEDGTSISYEYNQKGMVTKKTWVDTNDHLLKEERFGYKGSLLEFKQDSMGFITVYQYDGAGRKVTETIAGVKSIHYEYDDFGRLTKLLRSTNGNDQLCEVYGYDWLDRVTSKVLTDSSGNVYASETYQYDILGNQTQKAIQYAEGEHAVYKALYDFNNNKLWQENPLGQRVSWSHNFHYKNAIGQNVLLKISLDSMGRPTHEEYDSHGRVTRRSIYDEGQEISNTRYFYDAKGHLTQQHASVTLNGQFIRDYKVAYEYTARGYVASETELPADKSTRYVYDSMGRLIQRQKPDGIILYYTYDSLGRVKTLCSSDKTIHYSYLYDLNDNVIETHDFVRNLVQKRHHDLLGRLCEEELVPEVVMGYQYDLFDRPIKITFPDSTYIQYTYAPCHLTRVERFDSSGKSLYYIECPQYDMAGHLLKEITPAGEVFTTYDLLGRAIAIQAPNWQSTGQLYDDVGNLLKKTLNDYTGIHLSEYSYDRYDNLMRESHDEAHQYVYDSLGNCLIVDDKEQGINQLNQLVADGDSTYNYDANGNLISQSSPPAVYHYDALNRLTSSVKEGVTTNFVYDTFSRCLLVENGTEQKTLLYHHEHEIGSMVDGKIHDLRVVHPELDREKTFAIELQGTWYVAVQDQWFNVGVLLDQNGSPAEWTRYSAFGVQAVDRALGVSNPWRYANRREVAGLLFFTNRFYNPQIRRWQTADPLGFEDGLNLYTYVHNNPLHYHDPDGRFAFAIPLIALGFGSAGISVSTATLSTICGAGIGCGLAYVTYRSGVIDYLSDLNLNFSEVEERCGYFTADRTMTSSYDTYRNSANSTQAVPEQAATNADEEEGKGKDRSADHTEPKNLNEQLTLEEAKNRPRDLSHNDEIMKGNIKDSRYPNSDWKKCKHIHENSDKSKIDIHFWENKHTGERHGFKFKEYHQ